MKDRWFCSDHHLGHSATWNKFERFGKPMRPFKSNEEMHEALIERHNSLVKPTDRVYFLGDFAMQRSMVRLINAFNGNKILVGGNHDLRNAEIYLKWGFDDVIGIKKLDQFIMAHYPIHPHHLGERIWGQIHGHLHMQVVLDDKGEADDRYFNVCVDNHNYYPVNYDMIREHFYQTRGQRL